MRAVALLHPGAMGAVVGAQLTARGIRTLWVSEGRGPASHRRAAEAGLTDAGTLAGLADCDVVLSVCPPAAALELARAVADSPFQGVYLDANAISPAHAQEIETLFKERGGVSMVDGGIVGPPPRRGGTTRLCLSGVDSPVIEELFRDTTLTPLTLPGEVGQASALKLGFAAYNKMTYALAAQSYELAQRHGVVDGLRELGAALPGTPLAEPEGLVSAGRKAWRWAGEMTEIAEACAEIGLPDDIPHAAGKFFERWSGHKDDDTLTLDRLIGGAE